MSEQPPPRLMIVAGEASGDQHAADFFRALRILRPDIQAFGMGGKNMREAGVDLRLDASELGVIGLWEVLRHYPEIRRAMIRMKALVRAEQPDLLVCVDYKEFNFRLACYAKATGIPVLFYIGPQVWAWRPGRIRKYAAVADMMAVIFPFEVPLYESYGIPVRYVGHPLAGKVHGASDVTIMREHLGISPDERLVGLLPGSRHNEVLRLLPVMLSAARLLSERIPKLRFVIVQADSVPDEDVASAIADAPPGTLIVREDRRAALSCCDAVATCSGTATLELALLNVPMVIVYRLASLSYWLGRWLIRIPFIGLANIIAGRSVAPELIQNDASPENIAHELTRLLTNEEYAREMRLNLSEIRTKIGSDGCADRLAKLVLEILDKPSRIDTIHPNRLN